MRAPWLQVLLSLAAIVALVLLFNSWVRVERSAPSGSVAQAPVASTCEGCHEKVVGLEPAHARIGCAACHLGDAHAADAGVAHRGLARIPGNLSDAAKTCGAVGCHPEMPARLEHNVMTTMNGVASVDRWVFGEQPTPTAVTPVSALGSSPADTHLRNLCASCHLGAEKTAAGPIDERSRGGGCNACHLRYSAEALRDLEARTGGGAASSPNEGQAEPREGGAVVDDARPERSRRARDEAGNEPSPERPSAPRAAASQLRVHPQLRARPGDASCFGCHSRSGRIALNYQGWAEPPSDAAARPDAGPTRTLLDGRTLIAMPADVHARAGLGCVDCHSASEVMGEGERALHREDQQQVACEDCHRETASARTVTLAEAGEQVERLVRLEGRDGAPSRRFLTLARTGRALVSTRVVDGGAELERPGQPPLSLAPPNAACRAPAHRALACSTCHDAWAPQCFGCHTKWDPEGTRFDLLSRIERAGAWRETASDVRAEPAVLGVRERRVDGGVHRRVEEFAPGMVLTLDRSDGRPPRFSRLFAPAFPHTVQKEPRACRSCHSSPRALGFGTGRLDLTRKGHGAAWRFTSAVPAGPDGLPRDAWTGFLAEPRPASATREDARPFTVEEQRRVLDVGACLGCHSSGSKVMNQFLDDPSGTKRRLGPQCIRLTP